MICRTGTAGRACHPAPLQAGAQDGGRAAAAAATPNLKSDRPPAQILFAQQEAQDQVQLAL